MKRLPWFVVIAGVFSALAVAQEHKVTVQKFEPPKYPPIARSARIEGEVMLALEVAADGSVTDVKALSGHPMLKQAAVENVKLWKFHCDDCAYGQAFSHGFTVRFRLIGSDCVPGFWTVAYKFPSIVLLSSSPPCIETTVSR